MQWRRGPLPGCQLGSERLARRWSSIVGCEPKTLNRGEEAWSALAADAVPVGRSAIARSTSSAKTGRCCDPHEQFPLGQIRSEVTDQLHPAAPMPRSGDRLPPCEGRPGGPASIPEESRLRAPARAREGVCLRQHHLGDLFRGGMRHLAGSSVVGIGARTSST